MAETERIFDSELASAIPSAPSIPPPAELPQFFTQQKSGKTPLKHPVPPQLHPVLPSLQNSGNISSIAEKLASRPAEANPPSVPTPPVARSDPSSVTSPPLPPPPVLPIASLRPPSPPLSSCFPVPPVPPAATTVVDPSPLGYVPTQPAQTRIPTPPVIPTVSENDDNEQNSIKKDTSILNSQTVVSGMTETDTGGTGNEGEHRGVFGWFQQTVKQSEFLSKMASKAKSGMDTVLTTLDPGMKDFLEDVDTLDVVVDCDNDRVMEAIIEGFHRIFSAVTYRRMPEKVDRSNCPQIIGHPLAWTKAGERLSAVISGGSLELGTAALVVQPFLYEISGTWFESALILLQFKLRETVKFAVCIQSVEISEEVIDTLKASSFTTTVGYAHALLYGGDPDDWQHGALTYSSSEFYRLAAVGIASQLKNALPKLQVP